MRVDTVPPRPEALCPHCGRHLDWVRSDLAWVCNICEHE